MSKALARHWRSTPTHFCPRTPPLRCRPFGSVTSLPGRPNTQSSQNAQQHARRWSPQKAGRSRLPTNRLCRMQFERALQAAVGCEAAREFGLSLPNRRKVQMLLVVNRGAQVRETTNIRGSPIANCHALAAAHISLDILCIAQNGGIMRTDQQGRHVVTSFCCASPGHSLRVGSHRSLGPRSRKLRYSTWRLNLFFMPAPELRVAMVKPVFCVVLTDGPQWSVEAEWPDGTIEQIDTFKGHFDAVKWVSTRSETWLRERTSAPR